ncbi:MAG: cytochrome-c peroxidase [Flavobacteriales bacterium]
MNKLSRIGFIIALVLVISAFQLDRFQPENNLIKSEKLTVQQLWENDAYRLIDVFKKIKSNPKLDLDLYKKSRTYLKRMEPLWEFIEKEKYNSKINGAPLLKPEPGSIDLSIVEPEGFQVIDELVTIESSKSEIDKLLAKLISETEKSMHYTKQFPYRDYVFFESFYQSINRFYNLGISDFDTPGTESEFVDGLTLINYWKQISDLYFDKKWNKNHKKEIQKISKHLDNISEILSHPEQIVFMDLLRNEVLPLQTTIKTIQKESGVEFLDEISQLPNPVNTRAEHFMQPDYLNTAYFSGIKDSERAPELIRLGKVLFNDPVLSGNNKRACASCHNPKLAFADGKAKSTHFSGNGEIKRNSPGLLNSVFAKDFFHDLRAESLQSQADMVINNPDEFNSDFKSIVSKLEKSEEYKTLFITQFGNQKYAITKHSITKAIAAYISSLQSFNAPFDAYVRQESDEMSEEAKAGYNTFMSNGACATCHFAPTFAGLLPPFYNDTESEILGVWQEFDTINPVLDQDLGRGVNGKIRSELDIYIRSFKTVTLRNINETGPYMHHGQFNSLEEVMHFYNQGGGDGMLLTTPFQTLSAEKLNLTQTEMNEVIAFMKQLSDNPFINDKPLALPKFNSKELDNRVWGGEY